MYCQLTGLMHSLLWRRIPVSGCNNPCSKRCGLIGIMQSAPHTHSHQLCPPELPTPQAHFRRRAPRRSIKAQAQSCHTAASQSSGWLAPILACLLRCGRLICK